MCRVAEPDYLASTCSLLSWTGSREREGEGERERVTVSEQSALFSVRDGEVRSCSPSFSLCSWTRPSERTREQSPFIYLLSVCVCGGGGGIAEVRFAHAVLVCATGPT